MCFLCVTWINWAASHWWHWQIECKFFFFHLIAVQKCEFESLQALRILKRSRHTVRCIMTGPTETELPTIYATHHSSVPGRRRGCRSCRSTLCSSGSPTPPLNANCLPCLISVSCHPAKGRPLPKKTWKWNTLFVCSSLTSWYFKRSCVPLRKGVQRGWGSVYLQQEAATQATSCIWAGVELARCCDKQTCSTGSGEERHRGREWGKLEGASVLLKGPLTEPHPPPPPLLHALSIP